VLKINDATNFRRSVAGLCLILGPVLIAVGGQLQPGLEVEDAAYLAALAESPGMADISVLLNYLGFLIFAVGAIGLIHVVRHKGVVLAHVGGLLALAGLISITALSVTTLYDIGIAQNAPPELGVPIYNSPESYTAAYVVLALALLGTAIGLVLLTVALWRAGFAPVWVWPVVLVAFVVLFVGSELLGERISGIVSGLLLIAAFGFLGVRLLRMPDREWERGARPAARSGDDEQEAAGRDEAADREGADDREGKTASA
jgi:hypothetical protein